MLTTATKNKINTARDILVGKIPMPTSQVEQITLALVYKFMSDMDKKARELGDTSGFFANGYEKYSWDKLMDKSLPARDRVKLYGEGLEKMALNPHIPQLFRDIFRNAFLPFNDPETLKLFLDTIDQFEYDHSEELGNAFEYLLQVMGSQGDAGQFRTPRHIIDFIVEVVDPSKNDRILDPACGTAGFLISAYKHIKSKGLTNDEMKTISNNFVGYDISQDMQRLSLVNLYLHHFPDPHIFEYDTLTSEDRWNDDFDVVLANPPFMTPKGGIRPHNRFSVPSNRAEVLFVDYITEHLTVNGKAGVIVPEGIIFQSQNAYQKLRKMMVDDDYLWAVVSLPSGVFQPYSGVKTSILLFDRQLAKKTNKVLFIRINNDGYDLGAQRRPTKLNDLPQALETLKRYKEGLIEGKDTEFGKNDMAHIVEKKVIRESGYNLSSEGYKTNTKMSNHRFSVVSLSNPDFFRIESGGTPSTQNDSYWNGEINWATLVDLPQENLISEIAGTARTISHLGLNNSSAKLLPPDSVIVSTRATIGRVAINKAPLATNQGFKNIVIKDKSKVLSKFVAYMLTARVDDMKKMASGGTFAELSKTNFLKLGIPLPPISVQQEIVDELDRYQKIVDGAKQIIDNYQPSFRVEEDWELFKLGDIFLITSGKFLPKKNQNEGEYKVYGGNGVTGKHDSWLLDKPTLIIGRVGEYCGTVHITEEKSWVTDNALYVSEYKIKIDQNFLKYMLDKIELNKYAKRGGQPSISQSSIYKIEVPIPSLDKQQKIVNEIEKEKDLVISNKMLIDKFETKIKSRIDEIWGQN